MSPRGSSARLHSATRVRWLLLIAISLVLLLGAELALRIFVNYDSKWNLRIGAGKQFDPVTQFRNRPDYRFRSGATTNERGYFAPPNLSRANPTDRLRLIFMGDSVSFLPTTDNHPTQLERLLRERGFAVEKLNAAVPGFASHNVRALFENEISEYEADLFLLNVGWNDLGQFGPEGLPYKRHTVGYEVSALERLFANVYLVRVPYALARFMGRFEPAFDAPLREEDAQLYDDYDPQHYYENLSAILTLATERYPRVFVMNLATLTSEDPSRHQLETAHFPVGMDKNMRKLHRLVRRYNETIERVAKESGVPVIDLYSAFQNDEARLLMNDSCHVDAHGAELIAHTVLGVIEASLPAADEYPARL